MPRTSSLRPAWLAAVRTAVGSGMTVPASRAPPSVSGTVCRFIAGEPMNPATNWFTGLS